jgi:apoptosis-inducing factor 2
VADKNLMVAQKLKQKQILRIAINQRTNERTNMTIPSKYLVVTAQVVLWAIFMAIDACLLIPSIIYRYVSRIQSRPSDSARGQPRTKTVVIVGGNFAGLTALRDLQNHPFLRVILIERRDYFEYTPGVLRLFCEPHLIHKLAYPLPHGSHQIIQGTVTHTDAKHVTFVDLATRKSTRLEFDYLIMATGSTYSYPVTASPAETTIATRANGWKAAARQVEEAKSILILGGGAVGTELAAEILDHYPTTKTVTLVDACPKLVPLFAPAVSDYATHWLTARGCKLVLGQLLDKWDSKSCTLQNGQVLRADLVFVCFGDKPNSGPLTGNHKTKPISNGNNSSNTSSTNASKNAPVKLNRRKCIQVDAYLRVSGHSNIFCCGDVAAPPTEGVKQGFHAEMQGMLAATNVIRLVTGRPFIRYPEDVTLKSQFMPMVYVLSLGKWDGVLGFNRLVVPGPLAAISKWIVEWTKIRQMLGRPVGVLIWLVADALVFFVSKNFLPPEPTKKVP